MNWPPSKTEWNEMVKKVLGTGRTLEPRVVSYKEYKVLERLASEGKLSADGFPKAGHMDEFIKLMREIK